MSSSPSLNAPEPARSAPASWRNLPRKDQLAVLTFCRIFDFMQIASFQTVCYYQLKSFDPSLSEEALSWQTGFAQGVFTASQSCTAILWGHVADAEWGGRKRVLLMGLVGMGLSCVGLAFSLSFWGVVLSRVLGGAINGTVVVVRTMMSETIQDRKHQARAFLLLPVSFSIAAVVGPVCAGWLADPAKTYLSTFGKIQWLIRYPYALPALLSAISLCLISTVVFLMLEETLESCRGRPDMGIRVAQFIKESASCARRQPTQKYALIKEQEVVDLEDIHVETHEARSSTENPVLSRLPALRLPFYRILTPNVLLTMLNLAIFEFHLGAFGSVWPLLLSSSRGSESHTQNWLHNFNGGLGMQPRSVGSAMAIMGVAGLALQIFIYPYIHGLLGTVKCFRVFSPLFPLAYIVAPFLAVISANDATTTEILIWVGITLVLLIHVTGRIFVMPASITLLNNCSPHPSALSIVHGIGQTTSAFFRTTGLVFAGYLNGVSLSNGGIIVVWWTMGGVALLGWLTSLFVREGSGHEILVEDEIEA